MIKSQGGNAHRRLSQLAPSPADRHRLVRFVPVFALSSACSVLGPAAYMALFNYRLGPAYLPDAYLLMAIGLLVSTALVAELFNRLPRARFHLGLSFILAGVVSATALLIILFPQIGALYLVAVVISDIVLVLRDMQLWSIALVACDTQQARRLFPLFTAAKVVGSILGGLVAGPLARAISAPGVYLSVGGLLLLTTLALIPTARAYLRLPATAGSTRRKGSALVTDLTYLRASPFFVTMIGVAAMLITLLYTVDYIYYVTAQATFRDEATLTGFFGLFMSVYNAAAIVVSLGVTGRLLQRWGVGNVIVGVAGAYLVAMGLLMAGVAGPAALGFVFIASLIIELSMFSVGEPSLQVFYKVVPLEQRDGMRMLIEGIYTLLGAGLGAGLVTLHTRLGISLGTLALITFVLAGGFMIASLRMRGLYLPALLDALIAGHTEMMAEAPAWLGRPTPAILATLHRALADPRAGIRELALQVLARLNSPETLAKALPLLKDPSPAVQIAAVHCVVAIAASPSVSPAARSAAAQTLLPAALAAPSELAGPVMTGLERLNAPERPGRLVILDAMLHDRHLNIRAASIEAIGEAKLLEMAPNLLPFLSDENAWIRERAIHALGKLGYLPAIPALLSLMPTADRTLRGALIEALSQMDNAKTLQDALSHLAFRPQADLVQALARSRHGQALRRSLTETALTQLETVWRWSLTDLPSSGSALLLCDRLSELRQAVCDAALALLAATSDSAAVEVIRPCLTSADPEERANALEALDGLGDRQLATAISRLYAKTPKYPPGGPPALADSLSAISAVPDAWVQVIAAYLLPHKHGDEVDMSEKVLELDRLMMLKQVSLFAELSLDELQALLAVTNEEAFPAGATMIQQGEQGNCLFILLSGQVQVVRGIGEQQKTIVKIGAGEVVGEMAVLDDAPRSASVIAEEPVLALSLERAALHRLLYKYPEIAEGLLHVLVQRLRATSETL